MKLNFVKLTAPIKIDLREFILDGTFDCLRLGVSKSWLQYNFVEPDDFLSGDNETLSTSPIWRYGNIELHFNKDLLHFIFTDYVDELDGGSNLHLEKWIFGEGRKTKMEDWVTVLNRNLKNYQVIHRPELERSILCIEQKNGAFIQLSFFSPRVTKDPSDYVLGAVCLCPEELSKF